MAIVAKGSEKREYENAPAGTWQAVCVDVVDLGEQETGYMDDRTGKPRIAHKIDIVWQVAVEDEDGEPVLNSYGERFRVQQRYTLSLNEKANLRRDLESWRGKPFTDQEVSNGFDVEALIGANCFVSIVHNEGTGKYAGKVFANLSGIVPLPKKAEKIGPMKYTRVKDRKAEETNATGGKLGEVEDELDDDLPF
jgi:hypothetical protein